MHRYQPRIHLVKWRGMVTDLDDEKYRSFVFPESVFTAVTAYQNQLVTIRLYIHIRSRYFFYNTLKAYAVYLLDVHMNAVCGSVRFAVYTRVYYAQFYTLRQSYACVLSTTILVVLPVSSSSVVLGDLVDSLIRPRCGSRISRTGRGQRASGSCGSPGESVVRFFVFLARFFDSLLSRDSFSPAALCRAQRPAENYKKKNVCTFFIVHSCVSCTYT